MNATKLLEESRLATLIGQVERGEEVDWDRLLRLQALDVARAGELFMADAMRREDESYEHCRQLIDGADQ